MGLLIYSQDGTAIDTFRGMYLKWDNNSCWLEYNGFIWARYNTIERCAEVQKDLLNAVCCGMYDEYLVDGLHHFSETFKGRAFFKFPKE